jgi:hypothetical protein
MVVISVVNHLVADQGWMVAATLGVVWAWRLVSAARESRRALEVSALWGAHSRDTAKAWGDRARPIETRVEMRRAVDGEQDQRAERRGDSAPARATRQSNETA